MRDDIEGHDCEYCGRPAEQVIESEHSPQRLPCVEHVECRASIAAGEACAARTYAPSSFRKWTCLSHFCDSTARFDASEWTERMRRDDRERLARVRAVWPASYEE